MSNGTFFHMLITDPHCRLPAGASVCWSPSVTSCSDCLRRGPQCAWCFKEVGMCPHMCAKKKKVRKESTTVGTWQTYSSIPQMTRTKACMASTDENIMSMVEVGGLHQDLCVNVSLLSHSFCVFVCPNLSFQPACPSVFWRAHLWITLCWCFKASWSMPAHPQTHKHKKKREKKKQKKNMIENCVTSRKKMFI